MKKLLFVVSLFGLMAALANVAAAQPGRRIKDNNRDIPDPKWLHQEVERARGKHNVPALAACLVIGDKVVAASAVGHRKVGDPTRVTQSDRFCIGSCTKPMTSTLVGVLVEKGVLTFDTTLGEMFPELIPKMQPGYRKVTVRMLLSHTSGMSEPKKSESKKLTPDDLNKTIANRYQFVCNMIDQPPEAAPGTKNIYCSSNVIVVSYLERKLKKPYEELMDEYVFRPLGMATAGKFMMVSGPDELDSPWPHKLVDGRYVPEPLHIGRGFSRAPGGGACLSIGDFGKWAAAHLDGENGRSNLLRSTTFRELHRLLLPNTTMSFGRQPTGWSDHADVLWHNGAHAGISAIVHIVPAQNYAICVASNSNGKDPGEAQKEVNDFLIHRVKAMHPNQHPHER